MPDESSSSLVTTGQLDWVALARTPVSFTLEAISRIAKAGVEIVTVTVASAICSSFSFGAEGQKELTDSLGELQGVGAFSKALWFGFGVKSLALMLSETEQGACCVALCAALTIPYTPFQAAGIWRELAKQLNAPETLTPSIHQWSSLMKACSGSLAASHFHLEYDHFFRLLVPQRFPPREPVSPQSLADALLILARLSSGAMASATFIGGSDCALLATIAKVLLRLKTDIYDENDNLLFASAAGPAQATFVREGKEMNPTMKSKLVRKRAYFISSGEEILDYGNPDVLTGPTQWSTIFQDAFPTWHMLTAPTLSTAFSVMLREVALQNYNLIGNDIATSFLDAHSYKSRGMLHLYSPLQGKPPNSVLFATDFLRQARSTFPELSAVTPSPEAIIITPGTYEESVAQLREACQCKECGRETLEYQWPENLHCFYETILAVLQVVRYSLRVKIHKGVHSNLRGVRAIERGISQVAELRSGLLPKVLYDLDTPTQILSLFTSQINFTLYMSDMTAVCAHGICVSSSLLLNPNEDPDATRLEVMPGNIQHNHHHYQSVADPWGFTNSTKIPNVYILDNTQMIVEENDDPNTLTAFYRLTLRGGYDLDLHISTARSRSASMLLDEYRPGESTAHLGRTFVADMQPRILKDKHIDSYYWSFISLKTVTDDARWQMLNVTLYVLQTPLLLYISNRNFTKTSGALLKMCCCYSCVRQLTCLVMATCPATNALGVPAKLQSIDWKIIVVDEIDGERKLSKYKFAATGRLQEPVAPEPVESEAVEPAPKVRTGRVSRLRKVVGSWVSQHQ